MVGTTPDLRIWRSAVIKVRPYLKYLGGSANATAQIFAFIGRTENLFSTSDEKDSTLTLRGMRFLPASMANRVMHFHSAHE